MRSGILLPWQPDHNFYIFYRDHFIVTPTEIPINPDYSGSSAPIDAVYKDENVTVFALPIIPMDPANEAISTILPDIGLRASSPGTLKRKRTPSPFSPSKRDGPPHYTQSDRASSSTSIPPAGRREHPTIENLMKDPNFNPRVLDGATAHEWRESVVQAIFRSAQPTPNEKVSQPTSTNAPAGNNTIATEQGMGRSPVHIPVPKRVFHPPAFQNQLPPFSLLYRKVTNTPETKPTLAYVIVGPPIRGKFDAAKAKDLNVPFGRQRGELTRGNAITFMVPDESGGMVERTVQPDEVVGPSECPSVSTAYSFFSVSI